MKRCAQGAGSESPASAVARKNVRVEAILQAQLVLHPDAACEADELLAASEKDVLAVVYLNAVNLERGGAAAEQTASFEELDAGTGLLQAQGRRKTGKPAADDRLRAREPRSHDHTQLFRLRERGARFQRKPGIALDLLQ